MRFVYFDFLKTGIEDVGSPHVITFADVLPNTYTFTMDTLSTLAASAAFVTSITSANGVATNLVDGATYDILFRYVDLIGNVEATTSASTIFFAGSTTLIPTFARPAENVRLPQQFVIDFTLAEPAHPSTLTMTFTPNRFGANDVNGARIITFDSSFETSGRHQLSADRLSQLSSLAGVTSVAPAEDLINDGVYDVVIAYKDTAEHAAVTVMHANVTFDTVTQLPTLIAPVTLSRAKTAFVLDFTLPENALADSLSVALTSLGGGATDAITTRSITFDVDIEVLGNHPFVMTNLSVAATDIAGVEAVTPAIDLVHGAYYIFTLKYQDYLGNDQASDESSSVLFDTHTVAPVFTSPSTNDYIKVDFSISFALLEPALATTVVLEIHPTGTTSPDHTGATLAPSVDTGTDLTLTFDSSFETVATHTISAMTRLETAVTSIVSVSSIVPTARDLIHGNIYDFTLSYRDQANNIRDAVIHSSIRFDTQTETPLLILPATGTYLQDPFLIDFTIKEQANAGTVLLKIIPTGVGETDAAGTRTLTLTTAQEVFGNRQFDLGPSLASAASTNSIEVASIAPATDLVDGCVYNFRLQYIDVAGNTMAYHDVTNVAYAGTATLAPLLSSPASNSAVKTNFQLDFSLKEVALPGSLKLSIVPVSGSSNVQDTDGTRVVTFSTLLEGRGGHQVPMLNLSIAALESTFIETVVPAIDLKVGALYDMTLSYQDAAGNPAQTVTHTSIAFAGNTTLSPVLNQPQTFDYVGDSFTASFTLPERSLDGSVKMIFIYDAPRSIVQDGVSMRTVTFDHSFTSEAGTYTLLFPTMSTASQLSSISNVFPASDLVDGGVYTIRLEYQDAAGNEIARVEHEEIAYVGVATILPVLHVPELLTTMKERFPVDFTITEYALPGTVHLTFIPMQGDAIGVRQIFLTTEFERPGRFNFTMEALSTCNVTMSQVKSISTVLTSDSSVVAGTPNLLNGALYRVTVNYQDRAGNPGIDEFGNSIEYGTDYSTDIVVDLITPVVGAVVLDLSYGVLTIETLEHVNVNDTYWYGVMMGLDLTQIYLSKTTSSNDISIGNGKFIPNTIDTAFHYKRWGTINITIVLTEAQRIASILAGATPGGDGTPLVLDVYAAAMRDLAGNPNLGQIDLRVTELPDLIPPVILGATIHLGNGTIVISVGEAVDALPVSNVDLTKMTLVNVLNIPPVVNDGVALSAGTVTGTSFTAYDFSGRCTPAAVKVACSDIVTPTDQGSCDPQSVGTCAGGADATCTDVADGPATTCTGINDSTGSPCAWTATNICTYASGNGPLRVQVLEGAYRDIGLNPCLNVPVLAFNEYPDTIRPMPIEVIIEYDIGKVVMIFDEYIDATPQTTMDLYNIFIANHTDGTDLSLAYLVSFQEIDGLNITLFLNEVYRNNGLRMSGVTGGDGHTAFMNFGQGSFQDIAGNLNAHWTSIVMTEIPDTRPPEIIGSELFYGSGLLFIHFSETIDVTPTTNVNVSGFYISNQTTLDERGTIHVEGGRVATPISDNSTFAISLTEAQRAQAVRMSGVPGGDTGNIILDVLAGTVFDLAGNPNVLFFHVVIVEHEDDVPPIILSSSLNLSTGYLIIKGSETLDVTPTALEPIPPLDASQIALVNSFFTLPMMELEKTTPGSSNDLINLQGAEYIYCNDYPWNCDGVDVTIVLTEYQRSRAIAMSNTPGGDGTGMTLSLLENAIRDIALNFQNTTHNVTVNETVRSKSNN